MSKALKAVLTGIIFILSALFFMGLCIINDGAFQGVALALFILGIIVSVFGLFVVGEDDDE